MDKLEQLLKQVAEKMGAEFTRELSKAVSEYGSDRYDAGFSDADDDDGGYWP